MALAGNDSTSTERYLRRRGQWRRVGAAFVVLLSGSAVIGNFVQLYRGGDHRTRLDRRTFHVQSVMAGDRMALESADGAIVEIVDLIGIDAPDLTFDGNPQPVGAMEAYTCLRDLAQGRRVTVTLPPIGVRDAGDVLAYVSLEGQVVPTLNERLVASGYAFADRREDHPFRKQFEQAEAEARRRGLGLWRDLGDDQQPAWRQEWLKSLPRRP